jgi:acetylornithine/succinyldiaminopimelate/putrescine aminotransferase
LEKPIIMPTAKEMFYRYLGLPGRHPLELEISSAEGIYLYDSRGKRYTDLVSGITVSNLGHGHPAVVEAVRKQAGDYLHLMVYGEYVQAPQVRLAAKLAGLLPPGLGCVYYVNSGSEAVEGALKLAKRCTGRRKIVSFHRAYHGSTHGALSVTGSGELKGAFRPLLPGVSFIEFNNPAHLERITGETACVIAETIQAEAGIILPEDGFLRKLRDRCTEIGALLVIDDVQMGMGRTGRLFSFTHFGIEPDILVLAKAFGGGMPLGAFISSQERMSTLSHDPELGHITTFGGHPVSCAAALAALEYLLESGLVGLAEKKGKMFYERLKPHPAVRDIRRTGLMLAVELYNPDRCHRMMTLMLENGIVSDRFLFRPQAFRIAPPLTITNDEIKEICKTILHCLDAL